MYALYKPEGYDPTVTNGCGSGRLGAVLVPDSLVGLCIKEACNIHDYMYHVGVTIEDKKLADRVFLNNMSRIVLLEGGPLLQPRLALVRKYYEVVKYFGGPAFWKGKQ